MKRIFQSLGGRYTLSLAIKHLFASGDAADHTALVQRLAARYSGEVTLYHKGRAALAVAIRQATGGNGYVAISGLTCYSVVQAVEAAGCQPVYVDIDEAELQPGKVQLEAACQRHDISAVVLQHMLGIPADITGIAALADRYNFTIIEDLAHSAGAHYDDGREVGTVSQYTVLSFGRDKALDTVNGGALIVRSGSKLGVEPTVEVGLLQQIRDRIYPLITWLTRALYPIGGRYIMAVAIRTGVVKRSADGSVDTTQKLTNWQAALAIQQLGDLEKTVRHRAALVSTYKAALALLPPSSAYSAGASLIRLPLLVANRSAVLAALADDGALAFDVWYDSPVGPSRYMSKINYPADACPVVVQVSKRLINLPTHQNISREDAKSIAAVINKVARQ